MKKLLFILPVLLLVVIQTFSQPGSISGYVYDKETGEVLIGANIYELSSQNGVSTNSFGYFSLSVPAQDSFTLQLSYVGYSPLKLQLKGPAPIRKNFYLSAIVHELQEFTVKAKSSSHKENETGVISIPLKQVEQLPAISGESDIMKAIQLMPGVQSGKEGSSGLYVRGGSPDQNLMIIDDVPMYYVNHLGGFVSIFNTDALNQVKLYKAGFPARFGGRLSSIVDIHLKEGNNQRFRGKGTIGMISSKVSLEGPVKKDTSSFIISARRFMYDLITRPVSKIANDPFPNYTFYDVNAKFNHRYSNKDRIFFSFYKGNDKVLILYKNNEDGEKEESRSSTNWGNTMATFRWNHIYTQKLFSNISLSYTKYRYKSHTNYKTTSSGSIEQITNQYLSGIQDFRLKSDFEYFASGKHIIRFGQELVFHQYKPGIVSYKQNGLDSPIDTTANQDRLKAIENAIYIEDEFNLTDFISGNLGYRYVNFLMDKKMHHSHEPRLLLNLHLTNKLNLKSSWSLMTQHLHLLSYSGLGLPTDLWMPATNSVPSETASQFSIGIEKTFKNTIEIGLEYYFKKMNNLIALKEGILFYSSTKNWQQKIESGGKGESKGLELLIRKNTGKLNGWLAYTLAKTTRQFDNINNGKLYPYKYDRRHDIALVSMYQISPLISLSVSWVFGSGYATTIPLEYQLALNNSKQEGLFEEVNTYNIKNNFRMRSFHKLDMGISFTKIKEKGERIWKLSIYNLYNRKNPYYYFIERDISKGKATNILKQQSLFPFIPSVSYSFTFN